MLALRILVLAAVIPFARAQIAASGQKPGDSKSKAGNLAPHLVCTICGERNYNLHDDGRRDDQGRMIAWCSHCKRDTSQRSSEGASQSGSKATGKGGRLVLPTSLPPLPDTSGPPAAPEAARPAEKGATAARASGTPAAGPASFILGEVKKLNNVDDTLAMRAVDSLLALGPEGVAAARESLTAPEAPVLLTGARVLLRSGDPADADLVFKRMRDPLPVAAGTPLLELLVKSDPIRASPAFLVEMLEHPHVGVRAAAERHLAAQAKPETLALLSGPLVSKRADTRCKAIQVAAAVDAPESTQILLEHVADPSATVAGAAVDGLADRNDPELDGKLIGLAFRDRWILRPGACALIAIVEREDRAVRPILLDAHVEPLLAGLQSSDPFLSGTCATALAGIGFRSRDTKSTGWLDQDAVDRLVSAVSGRQFQSDLPLLQGPALRRLELLTGQGIGSDGPRWVEWWLHAREGFFARRAWLDMTADDAPRIAVRYRQAGRVPQDFAVQGPRYDEASPEIAGASERVLGGAADLVRLTESQARDLVAALDREGIFSPERLPGVHGLRGGGERLLEVAIGASPGSSHGDRGKTFIFGPGVSEPWFERTVALAQELEDRGRWQHYPDSARHATSADLWKEQSAWWAEEHTAIERALRLKQLVLVALPSLTGPSRERAIAEVERLYATDHAAEPQDFASLYRALSSESYWSETTHKLLDLALAASRAPGAIGEEAPASIGVEPPAAKAHELTADEAKPLVDLLVEKLSTAPPDQLAHVFARTGPGFATMMAGDPRPAVRAAAARALAEGTAIEPAVGPAELAGASDPPSPETVATLLRLLDDHDEKVEIAAVEALSKLRVESARTELLVRARLGVPDVRAAALRGIGRLGGEYVLDALSLALADADLKVRTAAAWGLADLHDPSSASLLVAMLGQGDGVPTTEPARVGLLAMGPGAWTELLRVVHSPTHRGRRDAALILSRQSVPEVASSMMAMLSTDPKDEHIASELAVLTGADLRTQPDPAAAWWSWWDGVVHDDALSWFLSALSRAGANPPAKEAFAGSGTREGRLFLLEVLKRKEPHLVERARRELARMLAKDVGTLPIKGADRDAWIEKLRAEVEASEPK
jgi:HEAT repeat protein